MFFAVFVGIALAAFFIFLFFFFNDTATAEIYTLSLHDALPICVVRGDGFPNTEVFVLDAASRAVPLLDYRTRSGEAEDRSEEHTSELQSQSNLVCRLLLEKKKNNNKAIQAIAQDNLPRWIAAYY